MGKMHYPYSRSDECSWQPEEAARRLGALLPSSPLPSSSRARADGYDPIRLDDGAGPHALSANRTNLLTRGRKSVEIRALRRAFGSNSLHGDEVEETQYQRRTFLGTLKGKLHFMVPVVHAFYDQLKEPLILMLLGSAAVSLLFGNVADAVSIALALSIVSLVAAVQEYRSEKGELFVG